MGNAKLRWQQAQQHNKFHVQMKLEPTGWIWNHKHKQCAGTGILGKSAITGQIVLCECAKAVPPPEPEKKD